MSLREAQQALEAACARFNRLAGADHNEDEYIKAIEEMVDADDTVDTVRRLQTQAVTPQTERDRILAALTTDPQTAPQLARAAKVNPCSIYNHLWGLRAEKLAACEERPAGRASPRLFWTLGQGQQDQDPTPTPATVPTPDDDHDDDLPAFDAAPSLPDRIPAHIDPRRQAVVLPGMTPPRLAAVRAAVARLAQRVTSCGLTWTIQPIAGSGGMWKIVESTRPDDWRLPGEDVCRRRLARWHAENFCPPRKDGLTPPAFTPTPPRKEARP